MVDVNRDPPRRASASFGGELDAVVEALCSIHDGALGKIPRHEIDAEHPSPRVIAQVMEDLRSVFFPGYFGISELSRGSLCFHVGATLDRALRALQEQIRRGLVFCGTECGTATLAQRAASVTRALVTRLPEVRRLLATDVQAAYDGDPAAQSPDETIFCYPGVHAITNHRIAHELYRLDVPLIPRVIAERSHSTTGIDIHPGATIGEGFFIDHGSGVVIGETSIIGAGVRIYQGVTLGAKRFPVDADGRHVKGLPRHPVVEDDVTIYAGATILGRVTIGRGSVIGGNVWLTRSVPAGSRVTQVQARQELFESGAGI